MKIAIALGSNQGDRLRNLRAAIAKLEGRVLTNLRCSPVIESAAWLKPGAPVEWDVPFLNMVVEGEALHAPMSTLSVCQSIEKEMGRGEHEVWSPRVIDIDVLAYGDQVVSEPNLTVPHAEIARRPFVLDPWVHLAPSYQLPIGSSPPATEIGSPNGSSQSLSPQSLLQMRRRLSNARPLLMAILNITPDSFSDGGRFFDEETAAQRVGELLDLHPAMIDLGGQSTRPHAEMIDADEEWSRLSRALNIMKDMRAERVRPWLSIDTFRPEVAKKAIDWGVEIINDVSGLDDPEMRELARGTRAQFVFMHHMGVPADPERVLPPGADPVVEIMRWVENKLELFEKSGIDRDRLIFDPGVGFGKSAAHSVEIIRRAHEFKALPVRTLIGHSRKSYQKRIDPSLSADRDAITLAHSIFLASQGIEILRVHDIKSHRSALLADDQLVRSS